MDLQHRPRILIVEDDCQISRLLARVLEGAGLQVRTVDSGAMAVRDAAEHRPDLVILDLNLPDTSGLNVCKLLRTLYPPSVLPVLIFTGMNQPIDQLRGFAHGADAYLTKPCAMSEVVETVGSLLEQSSRGSFEAPPLSD